MQTGAIVRQILAMPEFLGGILDRINNDGEHISPENIAQSLEAFTANNRAAALQIMFLGAGLNQALGENLEALSNQVRAALNPQTEQEGTQGFIRLLNEQQNIKTWFEQNLEQIQELYRQYRAFISERRIAPQRQAHQPAAMPGVGVEADGPQVDMATYNARLQHHLHEMGLAETWQRSHEDGRRMTYTHGDNQVTVDLTRGFSAKARNNSEDSINMLIASAKAYQDTLGEDNRHEFTITCDDEATARQVIAKLQQNHLEIGTVKVRNPESPREYRTLTPEQVEVLRRPQPQPENAQQEERAEQQQDLGERLDNAADILRERRAAQQQQEQNPRRRNAPNRN